MKHFEIWHYSSIDLNAAGGIEKFILGLSNTFNTLNIKSYVGLHSPHVTESSKTKHLVVHTHGDCWPNFKFLYDLKNLKKHYKTVIWLHISHGNTIERIRACNEYLSYSGYKGALRDFSLIQLCDGIIAVSQHALNENKKYFKVNKKSYIVPNGADTNTFKPLDSITNEPKFIFIGRSEDSVKNVKIILQAFNNLSRQVNNIKLLMAPGLKNSSDEFVINLGLLTPQEIAYTMSQAKGVILSSLYEGDALILREAMAMGLPIIASKIEANIETCKNYQNVFWFNPKDATSLVHAISNNFIDKTPNVTPLSRSWKNVAEEYIDIYSKIVLTNS